MPGSINMRLSRERGLRCKKFIDECSQQFWGCRKQGWSENHDVVTAKVIANPTEFQSWMTFSELPSTGDRGQVFILYIVVQTKAT